MTCFAQENRARIAEIENALKEGDVKLAFRLAHNLKTNAGAIGRAELQKAAEDVEAMLIDGVNLVTEEHMNALEAELSAVLKDLSPLLDKPEEPVTTAVATDATELVELLEPLLKSGAPESLKFIDSLRAMPGSDCLIQQMENFDFVPAIATLAELKKNWRCG